MMQNAEVLLFVGVLANQAGVPVPVAPWLLAAGALAASGNRSLTVVVAGAVVAALGADLAWYGLGRWRGARTLAGVLRLLRQPPTSVDRIARAFRAYRLGVVWSARFLPELNPIAAGLAGVARVGLARFLLHATGSALVWAGGWAGGGYLLRGTIGGSPGRFGVRAAVLIAVALTAVAVSALPLGGWLRRRRRAGGPCPRTGRVGRLGRHRRRHGGHVGGGDPRPADRRAAPAPAQPTERAAAA
jgi:membrane protein DedA with SNARE-associated domain